MLSAKRVIARIIGAETSLYDYKRKTYRLRRLVLGDSEAEYDGGPGVNIDSGDSAHRAYRNDFPNILVQKLEEGRNNDLLKFIELLVFTIAFQFPQIEIKKVKPNIQTVNSQYLYGRLREAPFGCGALDHSIMALYDYCMGGMGVAYFPMLDGKPAWRWADTLDLKWDQTARLIPDIKWMSISVCESLQTWVDLFGESKFSKLLAGRGDKDHPGMDLPCECEFYYGLDGERGDYKVFLKTGDMSYEEEPVYEGDNPNYFKLGEESPRFLPFDTMFFAALPSARHPMGIAEKMMPAQIATWHGLEVVQSILDAGKAFYKVAKGALSAEQMKAFREGDIGSIVEIAADMFDKMGLQGAMEIPVGLQQYVTTNQQAIQGNAGINPAAAGEAVKGIKFAAQQNDIRAQSGLTAAKVSKDHAALWTRGCRKILAKGQAYDKKHLTVYFRDEKGEETELKFGPHDPIAQYLRPDADIVVSEDSMRFLPPDQKFAQASALLNLVLPLAQLFPNAPKLALRKVLENAPDVDNVDAYLEQPQAQPQPTGAPGQPGMQNPAVQQQAAV